MINIFKKNINKKYDESSNFEYTEIGYKHAFENSAIGMAFVSFRGDWLEINKSMADIVGYSKQEILELTFQDITHPEDLEKDLVYVQQMLDGKIKNYQIDKRYLRKDGSVVPILLSVSFIYNSDGSPRHFLSQIVDMSQINFLKEEKTETEQQLEKIFKHMFSAFGHHKMILDENGKPTDYEFINVNPAFEIMTGVKRKDIIGKKVTKVFPGVENDPADWIGMGYRAAFGMEEFTIENYSESLKKWFRVNFFSPKKGQFVTIFDDVTEKKESEDKMRGKMEELTKLNDIMTSRELRIAELKDRLEKFEK